MNKNEINSFKISLKEFTGTIEYHKLGYYPVLATDGVAYFCRQAEAYWLFDEMSDFVCYKTNEPFVVANIKCEKAIRKNSAVITYEDGNYNKLGEKIILYTDLPNGEWKFFISNHPSQKVIMLPSEY